MIALFQIRLAGQFNDHASTVWRVCWNVTGTILASSGDDGEVKLWKANYLDNWRVIASLRGDGAVLNPDGSQKSKGSEGFKTQLPGKQSNVPQPAAMAFAAMGGGSGMPMWQ